MGDEKSTTVATARGAPERRRPGRPRKGAGDESTRCALVAAALELFAAKGFDGVSLSEIAKAAGAAPSLVHYYFASKDELWKQALGSVFAELREAFATLEAELAGADPVLALDRVIRGFVGFSARHPELSLILRNERGETGPRLEWLFREHWAPLRAFPRALIEAAQAQGRLRPGAPDHLLQIIIGACLHPLRGQLSLQKIYGVRHDSVKVYEIHAETVSAVVLRGLVIEGSGR